MTDGVPPLPASLERRVRERIRDIPDFPQPGILFKDITPLLADPTIFPEVIAELGDRYAAYDIDRIVAIESRGFLFGAPLALQLGAGLVPVRKPGKLPYRTVRVEYALEYGVDALEAHEDAIRPGERVLIVDDVLATGGTAAATARLIELLGGVIIGAAFVVELAFLKGRGRLSPVPVQALVTYD